MSSDSANIRAPRKARAIIDRLIQSKQLTPEGVCWLTNSTDPFHDTQVTPCGYPDMNTCNTIVQCFSYTTNITAPGTTGTNPFDCHVFLNPISAVQSSSGTPAVLTPFVYLALSGAVSQNVVASPPPILFPGFNVLVGPTGQDWNTNLTIPFQNAGGVLAYPTSGSAGRYRLIGAGFEVVNTTPELYKGGSVTAYRSPSTPNSKESWMVTTAATNPVVHVNTYALPPSSQANAQLYPTSRTWSAEEGCYSISTLSSDENPFLMPSVNCPLLYQPPSMSQLVGNQPINAYTYRQSTIDTTIGTVAQLLPYDINGCVFAGLNAQSTLQVTVKYYIERIPTFNEPDLLVLTRPPSPYDPMALEIYTRVMQELPVACMVKDNPLGEWFNDVLSTVAEWAPKVGSVFGPLGATLGSGVGSGAQMWLDSRPKGGQQPKQHQPRQQQQRQQRPTPMLLEPANGPRYGSPRGNVMGQRTRQQGRRNPRKPRKRNRKGPVPMLLM